MVGPYWQGGIMKFWTLCVLDHSKQVGGQMSCLLVVLAALHLATPASAAGPWMQQY